MSADKAREIVKRAMADRSVYDAMAAREDEVWGKILPERDQSDLAVEDTKAAAMLGISRNSSSLSDVADEKGLTFERGLTLGCGTGRCERDLLSKGVGLSFHGIDISERAIAKASEIAKEQNLPLTYEVADLNFVRLPEKTFDLVVAQTCLHHILFLEHVAEANMALAEGQWLYLDSRFHRRNAVSIRPQARLHREQDSAGPSRKIEKEQNYRPVNRGD